jgi:hypothetical protein
MSFSAFLSVLSGQENSLQPQTAQSAEKADLLINGAQSWKTLLTEP